MTEAITWIAGAAILIAIVGGLTFIVQQAMQNDFQSRTKCTEQGGVYISVAGACTFSKVGAQ